MRLIVLTLCVAWALFFVAFPAGAQAPPTASPAQSGEFFSGFVIAFNPTEITVNRKGLGKETAATKTFQIDPSTKVEGILKPKAHVTVRFLAGESGARAIHIIVR